MQKDDLETISMLITPIVSRMDLGEISACDGLFDSELLNSIPATELQHIYHHSISVLVAQGSVPLEYVGFDSKRQDLYRKK